MRKTAVFLLALAAASAAPWPDTVVATVSTGQYPNDACFSPDGDYVFVASGYGHLMKINTSTWTSAGILSLDGTPSRVACLQGNTVLVADEELQKLYFVDGDSMTLTGETDIQPGPVEFAAPGQQYAYLVHSSGFVSIIDPEAMEIVSTLWAGNQPGGCAVSSDGGALFIGDYQSPDETVLALPTGPASRFTSGMDTFDCAAASGVLYLSNPSWNMLLRMDEASLQVTGSLYMEDADPRWMEPLPGAPYMFVVSMADNTLRVVSTDAFAEEGQVQVGSSPQRATASADGDFVVVPCRVSGKLYVIGYDPAGIEPEDGGFSIRPAGSPGVAGVVVECGVPVSVTITLHDMAGRTVSVLHSGPLPAGVHSFRETGLPSGVYCAVVRGGRRGSCRLTVLR
jgi:DNA-binding beta-propeller fold protein YncE